MIRKDVIEKIVKASTKVSTRVITRVTSPLGFDAEIFFPTDSTVYGGKDNSQQYDAAPSLIRRVLVSNLFTERNISDITADVFNDQQPYLWVEKEVRIPRNSKVIIKIKENKVLQFKVDWEAVMEGIDSEIYHRYPLIPMSSVLTGAPEIVTDLKDIYLSDTTSGSLTIEVKGATPLTYEWYKDGIKIPKANDKFLSFINPTHSDVGMYHVVASNSIGNVVSEKVRVYLSSDPVITKHPVGGTFNKGEDVSINVEAESHIPVYYIWYKNDERIYGESKDTILFTSIREWHAGVYKVVVKSVMGEVVSEETEIVVL